MSRSPTKTERRRSSVDEKGRSKKKAKMHVFTEQSSKLSYDILAKESNSMRGFYTLFWVLMVDFWVNYRQTGKFLSLDLANTFSKDGWSLFVSDLIMVASTFTIVVFQKLSTGGYLSLSATFYVYCLWQFIWFTACIQWTLHKNWPWVQTIFFLLHTISTLMKQHSYNSYNLELSYKKRRLQEIKKSPKKEDSEFLEIEAEELTAELFKKTVSFPNNVTFWNYFDYLLVPSLVYEIEYPRTPKFRPLKFLEKVIAMSFTFLLLYITIQDYIYPVVMNIPNESMLESLLQLLIPFVITYLMFFFIIFEFITNAFAELTCFADRAFYEDWWNSSNFDEFSRKWNKPVHEFLLRHVYFESIRTYNLSKSKAILLTFIVSAVFHELVFVIVQKKFKPIIFAFQMLQFVFVFLGRIFGLKKYPLLANVLFWIGMVTGPPIITYLYCREYALSIK